MQIIIFILCREQLIFNIKLDSNNDIPNDKWTTASNCCPANQIQCVKHATTTASGRTSYTSRFIQKFEKQQFEWLDCD